MVCKKCGTENINATRFCVGCGAPICAETPTDKPRVRPQELSAQQAEIGYCGQPIPPKNGKRKWLIAGAAAAAVVLVLVRAIALLSPRADSCERIAEQFVTAYLTNDQKTLEKVTEKNLYQYLQTDAQTAKTVKTCRAEAISAERCTESEMDALRELYSYLGAKGNFTNAHMVEVEYTASTHGGGDYTSVARVALSEINNAWDVVYVG